MIKLVVLDRDGVVNHESPAFIKSANEWRAIDGSLDAIARLTAAGYTVAVASNQSGIGRGLLSEEDLASIHNKMNSEVKAAGGVIDRIEYCPHLPDAACDCRKPLPGMLHLLAQHYGISMAGVPVIGDSERDLAAARAAGARPILVLTGNGENTLSHYIGSGEAIESFADLAAAAVALARTVHELPR